MSVEKSGRDYCEYTARWQCPDFPAAGYVPDIDNIATAIPYSVPALKSKSNSLPIRSPGQD